MTAASSRSAQHRRPSVWPWLLALVAPVVWFTMLNVNYLLVPPACRLGHRWPLAVVTVLAVAAGAGATLASWRVWRADRSGVDRLAGLTGVLLGCQFVLVMVVLGIAAVVVGPCR